MTVFETAQAQLTTYQTSRPRSDRRPDPAILEQMQEATNYTTALLDTLLQKEKTVLGNPRLSNVGKQEKVREVAEGALNETGPIRRKIETVREAMNRVRGLTVDYMSLPKDIDRLEQLLLAQEIRAEFRRRPQHEKDSAFFAAAQKLDAQTMRAFMTAPGGSWVSSEFLQRAERAYAERRNPEAYAQLQPLTQLYDHLVSLSRLIAVALLQYQVEPAALEKALGASLAEMTIAEPQKSLTQLVTDQGAGRGQG